MSVTDKTAKDQTDAITFEMELPHPPEKVWRALTTPELLEQWLLPSFGLTLTPGVSFTFKTQPFPGWDGTVNCKFVEIEPLKKLSYEWVVGDMELNTVVTFTLTPTNSGTLVTLVQSGFKPAQKQNFGGARYGWKMMGDKLVDLLARVA